MDRNEWKYNLGELQELMRYSFMHAEEAYEALAEHEGDTKYQISLGYLNLSFASFLEMRRLYHRDEYLQRGEIESYFKAYDHYIFQLKEVITQRDKNTSWLFSSYESLKEYWIWLNKFIDDTIKAPN